MSKGLIWATAEDLQRNRGRVLSLYRQILRSLNSPSLPLTFAARIAKKTKANFPLVTSLEPHLPFRSSQFGMNFMLAIMILSGCLYVIYVVFFTSDMTIDKEVSYGVGSHASIPITENQAENSPSSMPTTEPPPQTIDQGDKNQGAQVQNNKKRKVGEASTKTKDVSNADEPGNKKPCRLKSWVWDHFTKVNGRAVCDWCKNTSYASDSHRNGTSNQAHHLRMQCKKFPRHLDPNQTVLSVRDSKGTSSSTEVVAVHFDGDLCRQALARMIIVDELPFSFVENEGFRYFMSVTQPRLVLPGRIAIARDCLNLYTKHCNILESFNTWMGCHKNDPILAKMAINMISKYSKYWGDVSKMNMLVFIAVIFYPRCKFQFVSWGLNKYYDKEVADSLDRKVKETLTRIFESYSRKGQEESVAQEVEGSESVPPSNAISQFEKAMSQDPNLSKNEVDVYLTEPREKANPDFDILNWWKVNSNKYPILGLIARDILAMPISTVASESAFSTGGRVLNNYRSSLTPHTIEALICAQNWLRSSPLSVDIEEHLEDLEKLEEELAPIPQLNEGLSDIESD
ncbi:zinc finger BED domain-containing protein RICESLEEPER [Trifolium repens]|nr:zinc finger BED domain-containing protein RICESLEEPER [Trifolium repens]